MRAVMRATGMALAMTVVVGVGYAAFDVWGLGHSDPKFGGRLDNFTLGVQLVILTSLAEAVAFAVFASLAVMLVELRGWASFVSAATLALATIVLWPPKASQPLLLVVANAAIAVVAGAIFAHLVTRRRAEATV